MNDKPWVQELCVWVPGEPQGKGSKRLVTTKSGKAMMLDDNAAGLRAWENVALDRMEMVGPEEPFPGPCAVEIVVRVRRPRCHYGTGRNANRLRAGRPFYPASGRDVDKVARAALDVVVRAGWIHDDRQVYDLHITRLYAEDDRLGLSVRLRPKG